MLPAVLGASLVAGCGATQLAAPGRVVDVTERDFQITVAPRTLQAGDVVFRDTNRGPDQHELIVARVRDPKLPLRSDGLTVNEEGLESDKAIVGVLEPGQPNSVRELHVQLKPGHYVLFCNMSGHFMGGMRADVVVQ
jgi:uncharacterized cupredoxin-like copper-binding protein